MILAYTRLEVTRLLRDGGYLAMCLVSPLMMYLVFTNLDIAGGDGRDAAVYAMVGMAGFGAVGAVMNGGVAIAEDKPLGWIAQLRLLPIRPVEVVVGRTVCAVVASAPPIAAVCLAGGLVDGVGLSPARWVAVVLLLWLGVTPLAVLSTGLGYTLPPRLAQLAGMAFYLGLSMLGGLWFPIAKFPGWLADVARATPVNRYGDLAWAVADGGAPAASTVAVLAGWAALFTVFATYACRRAVRRG
ncbi:ABC transporter permease [Actinomadura atramentaria]|uniref:ABC transporter permease n=1 Tax=Actinomadura atramentaria TaxID=1990 RepID=UPI0003774555|nr:ABC transporter permease [Actinomadura atramentaria]